MYKKTITYTDYNDVERTEDFYFNLNETELTELQTSVPGGYAAMINKIIDTQDASALVGILKELILKSYGIKSEDGRRFIKKPEFTEEFTQTPAFSKLYMALATDEKEASNFITKILPADLAKKATNNIENSTVTTLPSGT